MPRGRRTKAVVRKSLKACRNADEVQQYIIANDGLSDGDLEGAEFVDVGPDDDVAEIFQVPLDADTAKRVRQIAKKAGKTPNMLMRDWAARLSRISPKKPASSPKEPKKRATG